MDYDGNRHYWLGHAGSYRNSYFSVSPLQRQNTSLGRCGFNCNRHLDVRVFGQIWTEKTGVVLCSSHSSHGRNIRLRVFRCQARHWGYIRRHSCAHVYQLQQDIKKVMLAIGIIGSCIMPHNLYLHSGLVKTREIDRSNPAKISEANFYFFVESAVALVVSFIINLFVMSVFAEGLYSRTNEDVLDQCIAAGSQYAHEFSNDTDPVDVNLYKGGIYLGCQFGSAALYIWAVGLLAAGQSSTMTGCYAGQFTMEGFLKLTWVRWKRVFLTRSIAIIPSFFVATFASMDAFSHLNDLMNALMSIQLPFAVLPAIAFSSNPRIVGEFANGTCQKIISVLIFILIFAGNTILVIQYIDGIDSPYILACLGVYFVLYIAMCIYLVLHCTAALFDPDSAINRNKFMRKYILGKSITEYHDQNETRIATWTKEEKDGRF
uniref:Protein Malvolio n=1 Tax=Lygus hesperus TaxID=30085 RepID=A0A0A9W6Z7_LYGHE